MPLNDYRCSVCSALYEDRFECPERCDKCHGASFVKLVPKRVGIAFNGEGWPTNDSKKAKEKE